MNPELETLYKQADKAEKSRDFEAALECYQKILKKDPQEDQAYYAVANIYAIRGLVPQVVQQYLKLADILETKSQFDGAMEVCQWVVSIEPAGTQARAKLIHLLEMQARKQEAVQQSLILARIYSALGHGEQSIELLQKRREMDPDNPELILQLGEVYIKQGQIPEGIALYKTIAQELLKRQDYSRALDVLKRIKSLRSEDLENIAALGEVYLEVGKLDEAKAEYRAILRTDINHVGALSQLGLIAKMQGAWEDARLPFSKIVNIDPNNAFGRENLAEVNEVLGNQVEAIKHYSAAAEIYERTGQNEKAIELYQNILSLDSQHSLARGRLEAMGAEAVPKKRVPSQAVQRPRLFAKPLAYAEQDEALPAGVAQAADGADEASSGEEGAAQDEDSQKQGLTSKWMLKPGLKGKGGPSDLKTPPSIKPKGVPSAPPPPGGIPRTKPAAKPILTRLHDQSISAEAGEETAAGAAEEAEAQASAQGTSKPSSLIQEIDFPTKEDRVQTVYGEQEEKAAQEPAARQAPTPVGPEIQPVRAASIQEKKEAPATKAEVEAPRLAFDLPLESAAAQQPSPQKISASGLEKDVEQLVSQGKVDVAIQLCKEALKDSPSDRSVRVLLGKVCFTHGMLEEAYQNLKEAGDISDPDTLEMKAELDLYLGKPEEWTEAMLACAAVQHSRGHIQSAIEGISRVLAWDPRNSRARRLLISVLKEQGLGTIALYHQRSLIETLEAANAVGELIPLYQELLESRPAAFPVRYKLALCYQEMGKVPEAKQEYVFLSTHFGAQGEREKEAQYLERALSLDPSDEGVMQRLRDVSRALGNKGVVQKLDLKLGDSALAKGDLKTAHAAYQKVLDAEPENVESLSRLVDLYAKENNIEQALITGKKLGDLYVKNGEIEKAISAYQGLLKLSPEDFSLHRSLAMLYSRKGETREAIQEFMALGHLAVNKALFDDAIDSYRQILSIDGANKDARYQMGVILADHKNNWEAALAEFKKVKGLDPMHAATLSRLAKGYAAQGNFEMALQYVHDLIRLDPANKGLLDEFVKEVQDKLQKDPENASLHFSYGILCREMGNLDDAIKEFQVVLRKSPELSLRAYAFQGMCWEEKAAAQNEEILYQTGLKVYRKGLDLKGYKDEEYLELKYALARLHETLGKLQDAISLYQEIISVDMEYKDARARKAQLEEEVSSGKVTRLPPSRRQESAP